MTPISWYSLYCSYADRVDVLPSLIAEKWLTCLTTAGFVRYDPFALMPTGKAYPHTVKSFIAPPTNVWIRVLLAPESVVDAALLLAFAASLAQLDSQMIVLSAALHATQHATQHDTQAEIHVITPNALIRDPHQIAQVLAPLLKIDPVRLVRALTDTYIATASNQAQIPLDVLGGEVGEMAQGVNIRQAQGMFDKMTGKLLKRDDQAAARTLLQAQIDWESVGGQQLRAFMGCLPLTTWREPEFVALRDAYQLHNRRRRNPNAPLYPGDAEAMAKVPDALAYLPVFVGR